MSLSFRKEPTLKVEFNTLRPGELIVFHGIVAGERGPCLVVSSLPHYVKEGDYQCREVTVMTQQMKLHKFLDEDPEGVFWTRLSDRCVA